MEEKDKVAEVIRELILECQNEQQQRIGDLFKLNNKTLIAMEQALRFWCADAIIRLIRLPENSNLDLWSLYYKAEEIAANLNLDELTKCYLQTRDGRTLKALIYFRSDVVTFQEEIETRFARQRIGKAFAYLLDHPNDEEAVVPVLNIIGKQENTLLLNMKWRKSPQILKQLKALKTQEYIREESDSIKQWLDYKNESLLIICNLYDELNKAIDLDDVKIIPSSFIKSCRKANNPMWDKQESVMREKLIQSEIETKLPILTGEMEEVHEKIYDSQRAEDIHNTTRIEVKETEKEEYPTGFKRIKRALQFQHFENEELENENEYRMDKFLFEGMNITSPLMESKDERSEENKLEESIYQDELKNHIGINKILGDDEKILLKWIEDNLQGQTKIIKKVKKYFELILLQKMTPEKALKRVGLSDRTLRHYVKKLRVKLTR